MKVIRNGTGWDIAFDMVFTDKHTAVTIARRIAPLLATLVRDAVDASMCEGVAAAQDTRVNVRAAASATEGQNQHGMGPQVQQPADGAPTPYSTHSIAARVRAMGLSVSSGAD
jgi:hypothetical protein